MVARITREPSVLREKRVNPANYALQIRLTVCRYRANFTRRRTFQLRLQHVRFERAYSNSANYDGAIGRAKLPRMIIKILLRIIQRGTNFSDQRDRALATFLVTFRKHERKKSNEARKVQHSRNFRPINPQEQEFCCKTLFKGYFLTFARKEMSSLIGFYSNTKNNKRCQKRL